MEQIEILMSEVGPVLAPLAIDAIVAEQSWGISMEDNLTVIVQFDENKNCLVLTSELGLPPAGDRTALYELLLQVNYHWDTTGGNRMALNGPDGEVVQMFEISTDGLDAIRLSAILYSFADASKAWREIIQRPAAALESTLGFHSNLGTQV
jgi:hypothetical protein